MAGWSALGASRAGGTTLGFCQAQRPLEPNLEYQARQPKVLVSLSNPVMTRSFSTLHKNGKKMLITLL